MARETSVERAQRLVGELREASAEAAGVLKDLQALIRSARAMADEYAAHQVQDVMNAHLRRCQQLANEWYADFKADGQQRLDSFNTAQQQLLDRLAAGFEMVIDTTDAPAGGTAMTMRGKLTPRG